MVKDHSDSEKGNPLPPHRLTARVLLYAPSHRQDNTYHGLCYTSRGALALLIRVIMIIDSKYKTIDGKYKTVSYPVCGDGAYKISLTAS